MAPSQPGAFLASLPHWKYPSGDLPGQWDPVTSTLEWCELNYYITPWCAEVVNTLTNLLFIGFAYKGMRNCEIYGHDRIFWVGFLGYGLVGAASFLFHSTLWYTWQLADEMSMIVITLIMLYATFSHRRGVAFRIALGIGCVATALGIGTYYHHSGNPAFHQNAYALLTAIVLIRSMTIMMTQLKPALIVRGSDSGKIITTMWWMITLGLGIFLGGFFIWNLDNWYCHTHLRPWRKVVGMPLGFLLEGHGWWHLMTGTGAYFYLVWGIWLRHCLNGREAEFDCHWPNLFSLPEIVRREGKTIANGKPSKNGHANGDAKSSKKGAGNSKANTKPKANGKSQ